MNAGVEIIELDFQGHTTFVYCIHQIYLSMETVPWAVTNNSQNTQAQQRVDTKTCVKKRQALKEIKQDNM